VHKGTIARRGRCRHGRRDGKIFIFEGASEIRRMLIEQTTTGLDVG